VAQQTRIPPSPTPDAIDLTPDEQLTRATEYMARNNEVLNLGFELLAEARASQAISMLTQVNEILSAIKGLLRLSEQSFVKLRESVAQGNATQAEHEFVKIAVAYQTIQELGGRLRSARGITGPQLGDTIVEVIGALDLEDPEDYLQDFPVWTGRPPSASPFF
jgi:hypothetical protein